MLQEPSKKVYVPVPRVGIPSKRARPNIPAELSRLTVGVAFRAIPWGGAPLEPPAPVAPRFLMAAHTCEERCGTFFVKLPWTGEKPPPLTVAQDETSVRSMLNTFRWE
jgi:hypothetical protein